MSSRGQLLDTRSRAVRCSDGVEGAMRRSSRSPSTSSPRSASCCPASRSTVRSASGRSRSCGASCSAASGSPSWSASPPRWLGSPPGCGDAKRRGQPRRASRLRVRLTGQVVRVSAPHPGRPYGVGPQYCIERVVELLPRAPRPPAGSLQPAHEVRARPVGVHHAVLLPEIPRRDDAPVLRGDVRVGGQRGDPAARRRAASPRR